MFLKYKLTYNTITFWCNGLDEKDDMFAAVFDKFLYDLSKEKNVFFYGYRLWEEEQKLIDPPNILAEAKDLSAPYTIYWHLKEAKIKSKYFNDSCEAAIYYFEDKVKWEDFLATSYIKKPIKLIEKGVLSAYFISGDHGADFWFGCNKKHEKRVLQLFETLANSGYKVQKVFRL